MADEESRPLLGEDQDESSLHRPSSAVPHHRSFKISSESTPLLHRRNDDLSTYGGMESPRSPSPASGTRSLDDDPKKPRYRVAWTLLCGLVAVSAIIVILISAFFVPAVVKQYAKEAAVFKTTNLSIESATSEGVRARIQGDVYLNASRIGSGPVRNIGRFVTWVGKEVETGQSHVEVYLPDYGNTLVGIASLPSIQLEIRNGHMNYLDFEADLVAGNIEGLRSVAVDWLNGNLESISLQGQATLHLTSGLLSLGEQTLTESIIYEGGSNNQCLALRILT